MIHSEAIADRLSLGDVDPRRQGLRDDRDSEEVSVEDDLFPLTIVEVGVIVLVPRSEEITHRDPVREEGGPLIDPRDRSGIEKTAMRDDEGLGFAQNAVALHRTPPYPIRSR